jgi:L-lactate dehydrogenase complex protein LldG
VSNTEAREHMLGRIRAAVSSGDAAGVGAVAAASRSYRRSSDEDRTAILARFIERVRDYHAEVREGLTGHDLAAEIAVICRERGARLLAVPDDLPASWLPSELEITLDNPPLTSEALDHCDGVVTGCALAIAETGTLVLDGGARQGRRMLSLVPDLHLCVVGTDQIVNLVPEAIAQLSLHPTRPITFISGPSATSDIELSRVEGVHGPRTLVVLVIGGGLPLSEGFPFSTHTS